MNKKGNIELSDILIFVVLVGMAVFVLVNWTNEQAVNNGKSEPIGNLSGQNNFSSVNQMIAINNQTGELYDTAIHLTSSPVDLFGGLFSGGYSVILLVAAAFTFPIALIQDLAGFLGIPTEIVGGILTVLMILVVFAIINAIFGRGRI